LKDKRLDTATVFNLLKGRIFFIFTVFPKGMDTIKIRNPVICKKFEKRHWGGELSNE